MKLNNNPKIYIASKTKHADKWKELRSNGLNIISTWIDEAGVGETKSFKNLWLRIFKEVSECDILILYKEDGEILEGALIETGAAIANNKRVFAVGEFKTFVEHYSVFTMPSIESVLSVLMLDKIKTDTGFVGY